MRLDWERRYRLMWLHFAAELVLEVTNRHLSHPEKIGAHIAEERARIDFAWQDSIAAHLPGIAADVWAIIAANLPIESAFSDEKVSGASGALRASPRCAAAAPTRAAPGRLVASR